MSHKDFDMFGLTTRLEGTTNSSFCINQSAVVSQFAARLVPAADDMSSKALRNHINQILAFIADDIEAPQTGSIPSLLEDSPSIT